MKNLQRRKRSLLRLFRTGIMMPVVMAHLVNVQHKIDRMNKEGR